MILVASTVVLSACAGADILGPGPIDRSVTGVSVAAPSTNVGIGATLQLSASVTPAGANAAVTWSSDDAARITVSSTGLATAALLPLTGDTVKITATSVEDPTINGSMDLTIVCGPLAASAVSSGGTLPEDTCYITESPLTVSTGTLFIEPGVEISFGPGGSLSIGSNGRLDAMGTMAKGILFTSTDPVGSWRGLRFDDSRSADNKLYYVAIENGGSSGWSGATQSASALLLEGNSLVDIQNSTISGSPSRGITLYADAEMSFVQNTLKENQVPAWLHPNTVRFLDAGTVFDSNIDEVVRVGYGNNDRVSTAQIWPSLGVPLELQDRMYIEAPLTLDPGIRLEALAGVSLIVRAGGTLNAQGTAQDTIVFGSSEDLPGSWKGLQIQTQSTDNVFSYVVFKNGGSDPWTGGGESVAMVYLDAGSKAVFQNSTFRGSAQYGLWVPAGGDITGFDGNTFSDNARAMIVHPNRAGAISANTQFVNNAEQRVRVTFGNNDGVETAQTWSALAVPYRVMDRTSVRAPLTIDAGAELEFAQSAHLIVRDNGTLNAVGTVGDPITFRGSQALSAYWKGIEFRTASAANRLENVNLLHAGSNQWFGGTDSVGTLYVTSDGTLTLEDVTIALTGGYAAIIASGGVLSCTNVDDGGFQFWYYLGAGVQPTC
jgi:hypothetical protein